MTVQKCFIKWTMETSRPINHENEASSSTIYCNNASIIQKSNNNNNNNRYDVKASVAQISRAPSLNRDNDNNDYNGDRNNFHTLHRDNAKYRQSMAMTNDIIITNRKMHSETGNATSTSNTMATGIATANRYSKKSTSHSTARNMQQHHRHADMSDSYSSKSTASSYGSTCTDSSCDGSETSSTSGEPNLPYPGFPELSLRYLTQTTRPRNYCLSLITNPWFERTSILVILFNCITLGMYQPCVDDECVTNRCKILQVNRIHTNCVCTKIPIILYRMATCLLYPSFFLHTVPNFPFAFCFQFSDDLIVVDRWPRDIFDKSWRLFKSFTQNLYLFLRLDFMWTIWIRSVKKFLFWFHKSPVKKTNKTEKKK